MNHRFHMSAVGTALLLTSGFATAQTIPTKQELIIFGAANVQFEVVDASSSTKPADNKPPRSRVSNVSSDLGFKRDFDLGDGLTAKVQYVTGINTDNGSGGTSAGMFASAKDTFIGISKDGVGTLKLGRMTGAARWNSGTADFSPAGAGPQNIQAAQSLIGGLTGVAPQFNTRFDNAIGFESVAWSGFSARAYYSANENTSNSTPSSGEGITDDSFGWGLQYVTGPWDLRFSSELRNDKGTLNNTTNNKTQDKDFKLGIRYTASPNLTLGFGYDSMTFTDNSATGTQKTKLARDGWILSARYQTGAHTIYGGYGFANDASGYLGNGSAFNGDSTNANQWTLAYNYQLTKQVLWETFISRVKNASNAKYDFDSGGISPAAGATVTAVGAGLRITF